MLTLTENISYGTLLRSHNLLIPNKKGMQIKNTDTTEKHNIKANCYEKRSPVLRWTRRDIGHEKRPVTNVTCANLAQYCKGHTGSDLDHLDLWYNIGQMLPYKNMFSLIITTY